MYTDGNRVHSMTVGVRHIQMSIRAFLRLELYRMETAVSFYESKDAKTHHCRRL
jgi:hypothetical protein